MITLVWSTAYLFVLLFIGAKTEEESKYLGCYIDGGSSDRLITGYKEDLFSNNSPDVCINLCHSKGFAIAAMQYEYECFCGNTKPTFKLRALEGDCSKECRGDKNKKCGGDWRLSVYKTGLSIMNLENSEKELEYVGCFIDDDKSNRFLSGYSSNSQALTPHYCVGVCYSRGYLYAGLQYGKECYCGDQHPLSESKVAETDCSSSCAGDKDKKCGGDWRLSIYSTSITDYPADGKYLGCYEDFTDKRVLKGKKFSLHDTNTPRRCMNLCFSLNYRYAGLQYNHECFCGNDLLPRNTVSDSDCYLDCPGDSTKRCGGHLRLAMYRTILTVENDFEFSNYQYLGCFKDNGSHNKRLFKGYKQDMYGKLTPELCVDVCRSKGFHYSATQFRYECFCSDKRPSYDLLLSNDKCNLPCDGDSSKMCGGDWTLSIYKTGLKSPVGESDTYRGCYEDKNKSNRLLKGDRYEIKKQNVLLCISHCLFLGYSLAGLQWREECFCGDTDLSHANKLDDSSCHYPCPGDSSKKCGGDWASSVYNTGIAFRSEIVVQQSYIGCFNSQNKILKNYKIDTERNSPQLCVGICEALGYEFAGLEYGVQCSCGFLLPSQSLKVSNNECLMACPGDNNQHCGGGWRMAVYSTKEGGDGTNKIATKKTCNSTVTTANGQTSCKNEVIFYETFDNGLSRDVWQHTVKISDLPDENFVIFSHDEKNSFTENGRLHIKASLLPRNVVEGQISLIGCTGLVGTSECTMNSSSYRIIPPVTSAEISTKNAFYFRYGVIEIIAKFPTGDWIIPELYLEPKYQVYGPHFLSGRIKIAMALGNENLVNQSGNAIGSGCLESGILMGEEVKIMKRKVTKCASEGWNKNFHNYTIIWSPDDIQLVVDGEYQSSLMDGIQKNKLCEGIGLQHLCSKVLSSDSQIAPFDKDFYLKLGVTIGGNRIFPDYSTSNNDKMKPWKNFELKSLYKFWNASADWHSTWTDPSLQIESVKVTAL